jgi:hypothetical protein
MSESKNLTPEEIHEQIITHKKQIDINLEFISLRQEDNVRRNKEISRLQKVCKHKEHRTEKAVGVGGNVDVEICIFCLHNLGPTRLFNEKVRESE